ncbi:MAG: general stress protein CsbD [Bacteroidales bacterium]|nr:general stress protein CsbD [Bacteroidales bacterium]
MDKYLRPSRNDQKWSEQKEKLLNQFKSLTDKDLLFEAGRKFEMILRVSDKLGIPEPEMKRIFQEL